MTAFDPGVLRRLVPPAHLAVVLVIVLGLAAAGCVVPSPEPATTTTTTAPTGTADGPLLIGLSVHVEGWRSEVRDQGQYQSHVDHIETLAAAAEAHRATLTLELGPTFVAATRAWGGEATLAALVARGHTLAVHADVGGDPDQFAGVDDFAAELTRQKAAVEALVPGVEVTHVTGICSADPWVEAAVAAGFTTTAGLVEHCAMSLDPAAVPDGVRQDCASPIDCHGEPPRAYPAGSWVWFAEDSAQWLTPAESGLLLIAGGGAGPTCASEAESGVTVTTCVGDDRDLELTTAAIDEGLTDRASDPAGEHTEVVWFTQSVGPAVDAGYSDTWFALVEARVRAGEVAWATPAGVLATA